MACVPRDRVGMASGMSTTMRFSAIVLAIGVFGALLGSHTEQNLQTSLQQDAGQWLEQSHFIASRVVAGDMQGALSQLPAQVQAQVQPMATRAFVAGFAVVLWVASVLGLIGAVLVGTLMRNPIPPQPSLQPSPGGRGLG